MAAARKAGGQPGVDDLEGIAFSQDAAAQTQDIGVVVEAREPRGLDAAGGKGPDAAHLSRRNGCAMPRGTYQHPHRADIGAYCVGHQGRKFGVVTRGFRVGAEIHHLVALAAHPIE